MPPDRWSVGTYNTSPGRWRVMHHVTRKMVHTAWALPSERRSVGPYNTSPERGCMRRVTGRIVNRPIRYVARKMVRLGVSHRPVPPVTVLFPQSPFRSPSPCSVPPVTVLFPQSSFCSPVTILFFQSPSCSSSQHPVPPVTVLFLRSPPCSSSHHPVLPVTILFPSHRPVFSVTILFPQSPSCDGHHPVPPVTILFPSHHSASDGAAGQASPARPHVKLVGWRQCPEVTQT